MDVGVLTNDSGNEYYDWVIEFQCVEDEKEITFIGVNFYSLSITQVCFGGLVGSDTLSSKLYDSIIHTIQLKIIYSLFSALYPSSFLNRLISMP